MTDLAWLALSALAEEAPRNSGPDFGKASPVALLVIVLLLIGTFTLVWSMNRHLKRLPESFGATESPSGEIAGDTAAGPDEPAAPSPQEPGGQPPG